MDTGAAAGNNVQQVKRVKGYGSPWWQSSSLLSVFYQDLKVVYWIMPTIFGQNYFTDIICQTVAQPHQWWWGGWSEVMKNAHDNVVFENQEHNTYSDVWRIYVAKLIVFTGSQPHAVFFIWQHIFVPVKGHAVWMEISSLLDCILCQVVLGLLDPSDESTIIPWTVRNSLPNNMV